MIRALLVDDEPNNLENLAFLLENDCAGVTVVAKVTSAAAARNFLQQDNADVIFLDIEMPGENGFDLLASLPERRQRVVFVTAYNEYAIQAIKASALDYLLKPVKIEELQLAVEKLELALSARTGEDQNRNLLDHLLETVQRRELPKKIALPQLGGINFIEVDDIVSLQADSNYTIIHLASMQKLVISKTLKEFEELLDPKQFTRIHKSYIVNLRYIKEYSTNDGGIVKMTDGNQWSISRRQLDGFIEKMKQSSLMFGK
jgi:two-component system LytT family response regulator